MKAFLSLLGFSVFLSLSFYLGKLYGQSLCIECKCPEVKPIICPEIKPVKLKCPPVEHCKERKAAPCHVDNVVKFCKKSVWGKKL